jgi:hypothetical protein
LFELEEIFVYFGFALTLLGFVVEHFHFVGQMQERIATLESQAKSCFGLDKDVRELMTKVDLFWGALEQQLPGILLKGNPIDPKSRVGTLLQRYGDGTIDLNDMPELIVLLEKEIASFEHTPGEAIAMILMRATIKVRLEQNGKPTEVTA